MNKQENNDYVQVEVDYHETILPFGEQLRKYRHRRNLNQTELGEILGMSKQAISRYELNDYIPKMPLIIDYAEKLHVTVAYLLGLSDAEVPDEALLIDKRSKSFYEIFANIVFIELGLTIEEIAQTTGLSTFQIQAILQDRISVAPLPIALRLSQTLNVPLEVWCGEKEYKPSELSLCAYKVAKAFMKASEKEQATIQFILEIDA